MRVFVDASAVIALLIETDSNHRRAAEIAARLESEHAELITSSMVIAEVLTVLSIRFSKPLALQFGERVFKNEIDVIHPNVMLFESAWNVWKEEARKDVSFVDAMSFAIIDAQDITTAFSFDKHFIKRDFEVLM